MNVEDWMTRRVFTCEPDTSMNDAAHLMWEHDCGVLPVVDGQNKVLGVITDRDLCMGAYMKGRPLHDLRVGDSMSGTVFSCRASDSIEMAIRLLGDHRVRRAPVVDPHGKLVGILSINDLVRGLVGLQDESARKRLAQRLVEAQASICEAQERAPIEALPPGPTSRARPIAVG
jgi:CBS domain-containing protein